MGEDDQGKVGHTQGLRYEFSESGEFICANADGRRPPFFEFNGIMDTP